jgi:photosystem II stability/assembly factor-like uncharacterized protein
MRITQIQEMRYRRQQMNATSVRTSAIGLGLFALALFNGALLQAQQLAPTDVIVGASTAVQSSASAPSTVDAMDATHRAIVREAGPEDGVLFGSGFEPFLLHGNQLLGMTGRAGIFKSKSRGAHWERSMVGLVAPNGVSPYVISRCQAPSEPRIVYVLAGLGGQATPFNGFFSTDDFGDTWTRRGEADTSFGIALCAVDALNPRTVYVSGFDSTTFTNTIWKSTDGGRTLRIFGKTLPDCANGGQVFSRPGILFVVGSCAFASADGGNSFQILPISRLNFTGADVSPDGNTVFVGTSAGLLRSTDRGASFSPVSGLPNGFAGFLGFDPTDPARIYASDGLLNVSTDGGASFVRLPAAADPRFLGQVNEVSVDSRGSIYFSTQAGPFRSDDGGQTFRSVRDGFRASSVQALGFTADGKLLVGVRNTQVVFRQAQGLAFDPIAKTADIFLDDGFTSNGIAVVGSPINPDVILAATEGQGLFRTDNGGRSWTVAGAPASLFNARMAFVTASRVYMVAADQPPAGQPGLYRSDDAGGTFANLSTLPFGAIAVDPTNPDVLYVGTYNSGDGLFKSNDGGQTLQDLGHPGSFSALAVDRSNPRVIYAGARFGQVTRSLDGGRTFAPASKGLTGAGVHGLAQDSRGTLFVWIRSGGLFASEDGAASWHAIDTGEALQRSGVEAGRGSLVADPRRPGHVYLGNAGVIEIIASGEAKEPK